MKTVQWAPDGLLSAVPSEVVRLLAEDGKTFGYAPSEGWSFTFGSATGDVKVEPGQWVTRHDDGSVTVADEHPGHSGHEYAGAYARAGALAEGDPDWMNANGGTACGSSEASDE